MRELKRSIASFATCEQEAIHTPNVIQGHGAVLLADCSSRRITHASANLEEILGCPPAWAIGHTLEDVVGKADLTHTATEQGESGASIGEVISVRGEGGRLLNLQAHRSGSYIFVDLQPAMDVLEVSPLTAVHPLLEMFMHARSRTQICELAVKGLRSLSGFDRVMAYRFNTVGDGTIIAESKIDALDAFLGMTYPAADIPPQARRLFMLNRVGAIADFGYDPVPLLVDPAFDDGMPIDMTQSALRGVSPIHCQYMRNMNVAASLTISLVHGDQLWGMLVCHHNLPRIVGPELRSVARLLGQIMSLLIGNLGEAEAYIDRLARQAALQTLVEAISGGRPFGDGLMLAGPALLQLVDAGGVIIRSGDERRCYGVLPPLASQQQIWAYFERTADGAIVAADDLGVRLAGDAECFLAGSGAMIMRFGSSVDESILWFRPELKRNIVWGGDPAKHHSVDPSTGRLSPRESFAAWNETTSGHSAPWTAADLTIAGDLRLAIQAEMSARASAGLAKLRHFDPLTGLANRRRMEERLREMSTDSTDSSKVSVLFLDLDRFKAVNDSVGHAAGDMLLIQVAERLLAVSGPRHMVSRLGGDEFVVLSQGLDESGVCDLAARILATLELPFDLNGHAAHVSASIGLAMAEAVGALDILQAADMAMYEAKQRGGNRHAIFQQAIYDHAVRKFELDHDLRKAVNETGQLMLVYQPLFSLKNADHRLIGFEALLRWRHPRLGWVSPDMFIPLAEKSGVIIPLGDWIIVTATRQAKAMRDAVDDIDLVLTINVSVRQLAEPGFDRRLASILLEAELPASAICLEVTESMVSDKEIAVVLRNIRSLGVRIAIDDFGTGFSSLSYLRRLPADIVKLDSSFLDQSDEDRDDVDFVGAVVALIHAAGMTVIQEGVETSDQLAIIKVSGADMVQGFMFGRPLLAPDAMKLARKGRTGPNQNETSRGSEHQRAR
ncbi:bifunctional diguanylate cyclase/phosphodiesterase [Glacieibacterium megasporae]|uniref:bifunctional diguanylate cyclase/phosphodiesterase n=1 Tax=Glacieibacterium megasporae TaxID=2835787 RepID=UPI001CAA46B2|nr:EAL domain-containing protein [Polymorphobacter megasporae]UAJ12605.1 EAL domain-containing protein [Polymorphobacter megasporae]